MRIGRVLILSLIVLKLCRRGKLKLRRINIHRYRQWIVWLSALVLRLLVLFILERVLLWLRGYVRRNLFRVGYKDHPPLMILSRWRSVPLVVLSIRWPRILCLLIALAVVRVTGRGLLILRL